MITKSTITQSVLFMLGAVLGGYTISNFPRQYLDLIATPIGNVIAFFIILLGANYNSYGTEVNFWDLAIESSIYAALLYCVKLVLTKISLQITQ
jgi:hypothetical protein